MRKRCFITAGVLLLIAGSADAGPRQWFRSRSVSTTRAVAVTRTVGTTVNAGATAQSKSEAQARTGVMRHLGGLRPGTVEGVGYSSSSPEQALAVCCYSNSGLPLIEQAVVRGERGWFATRIFAASRTVCVNGNCR